jgi:hypothetical protein
MIVIPVDIPGGFSGVHRAKKPAKWQAVGSSFRRSEYEWEDMPGTSNPERPALADELLPYNPVLNILIYK